MEEAELNVHPVGLKLLKIHINISFLNNVNNFNQKGVKLDTHEKIPWKNSFSSQTKVKISL